MKTQSSSFSSPPLHFIDTAPLAARYDVLMASVMAFIDAGRLVRLWHLTQDIRQLVRLVTRFETHNFLLTRKLDMLLNKPWRTRVLKQLGGMRRLKSWEAAAARNANPPPNKPRREPGPIWLYTDERRAESERLKAHVRKCARACVSPGVVRDRIRVDFEGEFRLAPIPKGKGFARQEMIYTQASICDYFYNAMPFYEIKGFGPATVWPAEFRAAIAAEKDLAAEDAVRAKARADLIKSVIPAPEPGPNNKDNSMGSGPGSESRMTESSDVEDLETPDIPTYSIKDFIPPKQYRRIFHPLP